jgi:hypothetical protein
MTVILPYDVINYINKFLPMPIHPISRLIKEYITMHNITNKIITVPHYGILPDEPWRLSFYYYMVELRFWQVNEVFNKKDYYFHMRPSFGCHFECLLNKLNVYSTEMNAYNY